ncbi:hypothetical protein LNQ81_17395 [Myroides sp. M-43]|uniref:hypothetical protein n=1 Tax=Myroides oncorhynchi TaxID=2893756 RepID=UPI001E6540B8|nr:hypothetical protein [Myroides oncorhynchi]MCC9044446.1 hypothetical protein [Myroides oncorhynchi]
MIKNVLVIAMFAIVLGSCNTTKSEKVDGVNDVEIKEEIKHESVPYGIAKGYYVLNTVNNEKVESLRITSQDYFDRFFGMAAVMGKDGKPTEIDFKKSFVLALIGQPSEKDTTFDVATLVENGDALELTYMIKQEDETRSFTIHPCVILVVDKTYEKDVRFLPL